MTSLPFWVTHLDNMSVPPRSTLTLRRARLRGTRYLIPASNLRVELGDRIECVYGARELQRLLRCHGDPAVLALLTMLPRPRGRSTRESPSPRRIKERIRRRIAELEQDPDTARVAAQLLEQRLAAAGIPERVGIFTPPGEFGRDILESRPADPDGEGLELDLGASLAVLSRRSGPLYLPGRGFQTSLVDFQELTLFFPSTAEERCA